MPRTRAKRVLARGVFIALTCIAACLSSPTARADQGDTILISIGNGGEPANDRSTSPRASRNGNIVVFVSSASNLVADDDNGCPDIFVRDVRAGRTELISVAPDGTQADYICGDPAISGDGKLVVFVTGASFDPSISFSTTQVFLRNRQTGEMRLISRSPTGDAGDQPSEMPEISQDGKFIVFASEATNIDPTAPQPYPNLFIHDVQANSTTRIVLPTQAWVGNPDVSSNGQYVAFYSTSDQLVPNDNNGETDLFLLNRSDGTIERLNITTGNVESDNNCRNVDMDRTGNVFVFSSTSTVFDSADTGNDWDVFIRDRQAGTTSRVNPTNHGMDPRIDGGANYVVLTSWMDVPSLGDNNGFSDVFIYDRNSQEMAIVSVNRDGTQGNETSGSPWQSDISDNGRYVVYVSNADNLVAGDTNGLPDVFRYQHLGYEMVAPIEGIRLRGQPTLYSLRELWKEGYPWLPPWLRRNREPGHMSIDAGSPGAPPHIDRLYALLAKTVDSRSVRPTDSRALEELRKAMEAVPAGRLFDEMDKGQLTAAIDAALEGRPRKGDEPLMNSAVFLRSLNAIDLDWRLPDLPPQKLPAGEYAGANFGGLAWIGVRNVVADGAVTLSIDDGYPAIPEGFLPSWPVMSYALDFNGELGEKGFVDVTFYIAPMRFMMPRSATCVLQWDGELFRDVTIGRDPSRGTITARSDRPGTYVIMSRAD